MAEGNVASTFESNRAKLMNDRATRWPGQLADFASVFAVVGGLVTLYGWAAGIPRLTQWKNDGISMFPNTAVCAVSAGAALYLLRRDGGLARTVARFLATAVL